MAKKNRTFEYKSLELEVKELSDDGGLEGYLARFGNIDDYGDIIEKGAFTKTLDETRVFPLLWHHDPSEPRKVIGSFTGKQDAKGLFIKADFLPDADSQAVRQKAAALLERGVKLGLSIGFRAIKVAFDRIKDQSVRLLQEVQLGEGSLTLFPANALALVTQVKSGDELEYKPYPNNHACDIDLSLEVVGSQTRKHEGKEYTVRIGKDEDGKTGDHSYLYPKDTWTAAEAKAHCKDRGGVFHAATVKCGALLDEEPDASTPDVKPQDDTDKPETPCLHLLDEALATVKAISNLMEAK